MSSRFSQFSEDLRRFISASLRSTHTIAPTAAGIDAGCAMETSFERLALDLFKLQIEFNAAYRRFCAEWAVPIGEVEHWSQIPAIPAFGFKELELSCLPPQERTKVFYSSGTTHQRPSRHFHNQESLELYEASLWPWFVAHLLGPGNNSPGKTRPTSEGTAGCTTAPECARPRTQQRRRGKGPLKMGPSRDSGGSLRPGTGALRDSPSRALDGSSGAASESSRPYGELSLACLTPGPELAPHSSLVHMFETIRRRLGAPGGAFLGQAGPDGTWLLDPEKTLGCLQTAVADCRPVMILGTAFSFVHLLDCLEDKKLRLPRGSRIMETGGYKGRSRSVPKAQLHALLEARLGVRASHIVCEYGMSELSSQAYDAVRPSATQLHRDQANSSAAEILNAMHPRPQRLFQFPPWVRVRIISPETGLEVAEGEAGLVCVFDLANVYSVLAIQTEDVAIRRGDAFELLGRAAVTEPRGCSLMAV